MNEMIEITPAGSLCLELREALQRLHEATHAYLMTLPVDTHSNEYREPCNARGYAFTVLETEDEDPFEDEETEPNDDPPFEDFPGYEDNQPKGSGEPICSIDRH